MTHELWFERTFDFTVPISRFPGLLERLRGTPARLEERVRELPAALLTRPQGDKWSVQENIGHLSDVEPLWMRRAEQLFAGESELVAADLTNRRTREANHNARPLSDVLADFRSQRNRLVRFLSTANPAILARTALHPRLRTPMRLIDLAVFVAEHDDHHLATITELARLK